MRKFYFSFAPLFVGCLTALSGMAQSNVAATLTFNKIRFNVNTVRPAFFNASNSRPAFHDTELNADYIYAANPWFGAQTPNGQLKFAGETYGGLGQDWTTGPVSSNTGAASTYNKVYTMNAQLIEDHKTKFGQSGYITPQEILEWPGSGVVSNGEPSQMAAFFDKNSNGVYDPTVGGDYPIIKGNMAALTIKNDLILHTETGGEALTADLYTMYYAIESVTAPFDRTIYVDYTYVNRGSQNYTGARFGVWIDFDLGNPSDDYVGTMVDQEAIYCYNGDNNDDVNGGQSPGFGQDPPSIALTILSQQLSNSLYYWNGGGATGNPSNAMDYYNYISGKWRDNTEVCYGGSGHYDGNGYPYPEGALLNKSARYMYPGNSDPNGRGTDGNNYGQTVIWDEYTAGNPPGDRRMIAALDLGDFKINTPITISTAYVAAKTDLRGAVATVRARPMGIGSIAGLNQTFICSPNPAGNFVRISGVENKELTAEVLDLTGRVQLSASVKDQISTESLSNGTYLVRLGGKDGALSGSQKLVICR